MSENLVINPASCHFILICIHHFNFVTYRSFNFLNQILLQFLVHYFFMGKVEGQGESWHGHVTAVTVAPEFRRQQLAKKLMHLLEDISDKIDKAYFVDLFVRASNTPAIKMYEKLGYVIYRRVLRYYSGEEDGLDMRKALSRDVEKKSIIPLKRPVTPDELEYD
ncbi:N-terminal acetyltransferase B complex catalytic subunit NAA20 isoform X3 [Macadamia integrifolia]|uniref:N-terminal acetyltransferase B complex catalytic subunit NAA20 isoform X3 n=1 Tax=Macadamia integrifolia TaxID=60698 RepID=UPI001C4EFF2D|nr:N-terminal acetyltransferase B complex catalytic subunit NAA20 isoform X3 [Macadamia integrifolia]